MFFTGVHLDYHRPSDDWDKINYDGIEKVVNFIQKVSLEVANNDSKLTYAKTTSGIDPNNTSGRGMGGIRFGIIPNFETSKEGLKIAGASPNTPADKAGLKENDIITFIDDQLKISRILCRYSEIIINQVTKLLLNFYETAKSKV
jgi:hypothetical protein